MRLRFWAVPWPARLYSPCLLGSTTFSWGPEAKAAAFLKAARAECRLISAENCYGISSKYSSFMRDEGHKSFASRPLRKRLLVALIASDYLTHEQRNAYGEENNSRSHISCRRNPIAGCCHQEAQDYKNQPAEFTD
jgi:hypothetical protein